MWAVLRNSDEGSTRTDRHFRYPGVLALPLANRSGGDRLLSGSVPLRPAPTANSGLRASPFSPKAVPGASPQGTFLFSVMRNQLVGNSLYLMLNSILQAGAGFIFWIISTHLFSVASVGLATSLVSAASVIAFAGLLGLNSTMVRFLPSARDRDVFITSALAIVALFASLFALLYVLAIPAVAPRLSFVTHDPLMGAGFVLLTVAGAVNVLTDSIFIGQRQARFNAVIDGGIGGITKVLASLLVAGAGAYGLFAASSIGYAVAAVVSLIVLTYSDHFRPSLRKSAQVLRPLMRFSGANYIGSLLTLLPTFIVPLILLDRIGTHATAYYYIAFQIVSLLYAAVYAVEQSFLSEGSHDDVELRSIMRRSWRLLAVICIPASLLLAVISHWLLLVFGRSYSANGTQALVVLSISGLPFGAFYWLMTVLRLTGQLGSIVASNLVFAVSTCGLAWFFAPWGLSFVVLAWPIGLTAAALTAAVPVWTWSRRHPMTV